jgi:hypothetical protein
MGLHLIGDSPACNEDPDRHGSARRPISGHNGAMVTPPAAGIGAANTPSP